MKRFNIWYSECTAVLLYSTVYCGYSQTLVDYLQRHNCMIVIIPSHLSGCRYHLTTTRSNQMTSPPILQHTLFYSKCCFVDVVADLYFFRVKNCALAIDQLFWDLVKKLKNQSVNHGTHSSFPVMNPNTNWYKHGEDASIPSL